MPMKYSTVFNAVFIDDSRFRLFSYDSRFSLLGYDSTVYSIRFVSFVAPRYSRYARVRSFKHSAEGP